MFLSYVIQALSQYALCLICHHLINHTELLSLPEFTVVLNACCCFFCTYYPSCLDSSTLSPWPVHIHYSSFKAQLKGYTLGKAFPNWIKLKGSGSFALHFHNILFILITLCLSHCIISTCWHLEDSSTVLLYYQNVGQFLEIERIRNTSELHLDPTFSGT